MPDSYSSRATPTSSEADVTVFSVADVVAQANYGSGPGQLDQVECSHRQEFVIGGYTDPKGSRAGIGSLLLGVHEKDGRLRYVGKVGTGFKDNPLLGLKKELCAIGNDCNSFTAAGNIAGDTHWVAPKLLAELLFAAWTQSGRIRHAVFYALRKDTPARAIVREEPLHKHKIIRPRCRSHWKSPVRNARSIRAAASPRSNCCAFMRWWRRR